jgi:hypothetical protein
MTRSRLITAVSLALFLRWLATGHVAFTVAGATVVIPALAIAAACLIALAGVTVAVVVYRVRVIALARTTRVTRSQEWSA